MNSNLFFNNIIRHRIRSTTTVKINKRNFRWRSYVAMSVYLIDAVATNTLGRILTAGLIIGSLSLYVVAPIGYKMMDDFKNTHQTIDE